MYEELGDSMLAWNGRSSVALDLALKDLSPVTEPTVLSMYISAWSRRASVPVLEHPNFLRPNLNQPISFCHSMEPPNFLRPSLEPLSSLPFWSH